METQYHLHIPRPCPFLNYSVAVPLVNLRPPLLPLRQRIIQPQLHTINMNIAVHIPAPGLSSDSQQLDPTGVGSDTGDGSTSSLQPGVQPDQGDTIQHSYSSHLRLPELQRGGSAGHPQGSIPPPSQTTQNLTVAPHHQHKRRGSHDHLPAPDHFLIVRGWMRPA
jgi:hypothetical protein